MQEYNPKEIEPKWQKIWKEKHFYDVTENSSKPKFYTLMEFPYPSGEGLHTGHVRGYTAMDIISRKRRMQGFNVMFPIGWDAFGLPTENYALKTGKDPRLVTQENTDNFRKQFTSLGMSFDWSREINTTDPKYYKWTQWIFLKFLEKGLAYKAKQYINWCPKDKIGLANEEVVNGRCERCGTPVEKREKEQWMLAITKYAERLLEDLHTVDYSPRIKLQQENWIGKSEGAEIEFEIVGQKEKIKIFTTRPDTIFGATFLALAPEVAKKLFNKDFGIVAETERENKEKLGIDTGFKAINPASKEEIPIWVVNYVSADYGTGAIMAVPAHDERDFEFAKKYNLPIKQVVAPHFVLNDANAPKEGMETVFREVVDVIIENKEGEFLLMKETQNNVVNIHFIGGGTDGEDCLTAAVREVKEESGYTEVEVVGQVTPAVYVEGFRHTKNRNQTTIGPAVCMKLKSNKQIKSEVEEGKHSLLWVKKEDVSSLLSWSGHLFLWESFLKKQKVFTDKGTLINSGDFTYLNSEEAKKKITGAVNGKWVTKYKLRDWVFSRQRYWGEPIPVIHCEKCGVVPVPEKDLPVELPHVEKYEPGPDGESPLANISEWVNVKCPKCGGDAKRETDVMPNWAGSSWYFLRYCDPHDNTQFANKEKLKHWMPVDWYNGGMEHTTLHLLYSRFWNKFLFDEGLVPTSEPYMKRTSHGLILAEGGEKMSKSKGNVVNPDTIVKQFGADTLRLYEMFMGPFEQAIAWSEAALVGPRRFLEKVWRLKEKVKGISPTDESLMHQTIKKLSDDIETMNFNTAISTLMVWSNALEKQNEISEEEFETLIKLLSPFAPHIAEELWQMLGHDTSVQNEAWPTANEEKMHKDFATIAVQVNGKVRGTLTHPSSMSREELEKMALQSPEITKWTHGRQIVKIIVVPGRIVNIVVDEKK